MPYLQSMHEQTAVFFKTVGFGFLLGVGYDLLRFVRLLASKNRSFLPWDIASGALAAVLTFLYSLTQNGGRVRLHLLAAQAIGFFAWYFLAGTAVHRAEDAVLRAARRGGAHLTRRAERISAEMVRKWEKGKIRLKKVLKKPT